MALNNPVLVLNKHYTALRVVDLKRAMVLLFKGAAEVIDVDEQSRFSNYNFSSWVELSEYREAFEPDSCDWLNCVNTRLAIPTIIRLLSFDRFRRQHVRFSRKNIFLRDNHQCQYCGGYFKTSQLNLDHVMPKSRGGRTDWTNIVLSCITCNTKKGARTPREAGMKLIRQPMPLLHSPQLTKVRHKSWKHFVDEAYWNVELTD